MSLQIAFEKHKLSLTVTSFFYPFTHPELVGALAKRGFTVPPPSQLPSEVGPRNYLGGRVATKSGCSVEADADRKILAASGADIGQVLAIFEELLEIAEHPFEIDLDSELDYVELLSNMVVGTAQSPLRVFECISKDMKCLGRISKRAGSEVSIYGFRLMPRGSTPLRRDWFDIRIEPRVSTPERAYYMDIVYRKPEATLVLDFLKQLHDKVGEIILALEEGGQ